MHGRWDVSPAEYAAQARRYQQEIGRMQWAAPQDWMCEPKVRLRTGLTVVEHQRRTTDNYLELMSIAPDVPWIPVLQGWTQGDYHRHVAEYTRAGVDLTQRPLVGLGTVCRRQATSMAAATIAGLHAYGMRLHGFGLKTQGLARTAGLLTSADSMAWSYGARARKVPMIDGHGVRHKNCANCMEYALLWRARVVEALNAEPDPQYSLAL